MAYIPSSLTAPVLAQDFTVEIKLIINGTCFSLDQNDRNMLATHSSYFKATFGGGFNTLSSKKITLEQIQAEHFSILLDLLKTNSPVGSEMESEVLMEFMESLDFLQMRGGESKRGRDLVLEARDVLVKRINQFKTEDFSRSQLIQTWLVGKDWIAIADHERKIEAALEEFQVSCLRRMRSKEQTLQFVKEHGRELAVFSESWDESPNDAELVEMLKYLPTIHTLELQTFLSGRALESISSTNTNLRTLKLHQMEIGCFSNLQNLDKLVTLSLRYTNLSGASLEFLSNATRLTSLDLTGNVDVNDGLHYLARLTTLTNLNLHRCVGIHADQRKKKNLTDTGLLSLSSLINLTELDLGECNNNDQLSSKGLGVVQKMSKLARLFLQKSSLADDQGLARLTGLKNLMVLDLSHPETVDSRRTVQGFSSLEGLVNLVFLYLSGYFYGSGGPVVNYLTNLTNLVELRLAGKIPDDKLIKITALTRLSKLDLAFCNITDRGFTHITHFIHLSMLNLTYCPISDTTLAMMSGLTKLAQLYLNHCESVTHRGIAQLRTLTTLEHLELVHCEAVSNESVAALVNLTQLRFLNLRCCHKIDLAQLELFTTLQKLDRLIICKKGSVKVIRHLESLLPVVSIDCWA